MSRKTVRGRRNNGRQSGSSSRLQPNVEHLETRLLLASDWTNPINVYDVDNAAVAEMVSPLDALIVINELNDPTISSAVDGKLPEIVEGDAAPDVYLDVNGDGYASPIDALMIINKLNADGVGTEASETRQSFAAAGVIVGSRAAAAGGISDDTLVNSQTKRVQSMPDVASTSLGDSVVVWQSFAQDGRGWGIYGQRFDATGAAVGDEFQVNTTTAGSQTSPAVAMNANGEFVVVWQSPVGADGKGFGVYSQAFDSSANPVGSETLVNVTTKGRQWDPDVAYSGDEYTVVWQGRGDGDVNGIYARTFADGVGGDEMQVNTHTRGFQGAPVIDANANGKTVVAWEGKGDGDVYGIFMRELGSDGQEVMVNADRRGLQHLASIGVGDDGEVAITWRNPPHGIWARTFAADGTGGNVIQVSQTGPGVQTRPDLDMLTNGGFAVTWQGNGVGDHLGTFVRAFDADGTAMTDETLVNQTTRAAQVRPSIAAANEGYIVSWQGRGEGDRFGVFARFFETEVAGPFRINPVADTTIDEGMTFSTTVTITDTDDTAGDAPTFALTTAPEGASIDGTTGAITWVTEEVDGPGTYAFTVSATEGEFTTSDTFMVTVSELNTPPELLVIGSRLASTDEPFTLTLAATDADLPAQTLEYTVTGQPAWLTFNAEDGTLNGTPSSADVGDSVVSVTVTDGNGGSDTESFTLTVADNQAPVVVTEIPDVSQNEGEALNLDISGNFSDPDGQTLTFSGDLPSWVSLDADSGVLTGTPENADVATTQVTITATDSEGLSVSDTFQLTVVDVNTMTPTVIEQAFRIAPSAAAGTVVGQPIVQDLDPAALLQQFQITEGNDSGAFAIDTQTGEITVANSAALASLEDTNVTLGLSVSDGTHTATGQVVVSVVDGAGLVAYSLQVVDPDTGDVLTEVQSGQTVHLVMNVQTVGTGSPGVFSAYADVVYDPNAITISGTVVHSSTYPNGPHADVGTPGIIDEAGGTDGVSILGDGVFEVIRVPMTVGNLPVGTELAFATNDADADSIRDTTIFNSDEAVDAIDLVFSATSVTVVGS